MVSSEASQPWSLPLRSKAAFSPEGQTWSSPRRSRAASSPADGQKEGFLQMLTPLSRRSTAASLDSQSAQDPSEHDPFGLRFAATSELDALELADSLEKGLSREIVTEFMVPVESTKLKRFNILRSEDGLQYRLYSDDVQFQLYARVSVSAGRVDMYSYDPNLDTEQPFDPARPAFTMAFSSNRSEWRLHRAVCDNCRYSSKHMSCSCTGKQQVAGVRHFTKKLGDGVSNCMEVSIPAIGGDGSPVVWCPRMRKPDLASPVNRDVAASSGALQLVTKWPEWNEEVQCLVLEFEGRTITASPQNFQLALADNPNEVVCQFGKIGPSTFSLDFKSPLSVAQAFGVAMSTMFLT